MPCLSMVKVYLNVFSKYVLLSHHMLNIFGIFDLHGCPPIKLIPREYVIVLAQLDPDNK